jgi:hypothetical protein
MPGSGKVVTESGTYRDTLYGANSKACDSFVVINLTIIKPKSESTNVTACESYTSPGGKRVTATGKIYETYKSRLGCDSIIQTINVTIVNVDTKVNRDWNTLISNSQGVSGSLFQWLDCKQKMQKIDGETSAIFAASQNGEYAVEITQGNCVDTSRCIVFAYSGNMSYNIRAMEVFPNPNSGSFNLQLSESVTKSQVQVFDMTGKLVWEQSFEDVSNETLDLKLGAGVYQIQVMASGNVFSTRLIIQ